MFEVVQMCNREQLSSVKMVSTDQELWCKNPFISHLYQLMLL